MRYLLLGILALATGLAQAQYPNKPLRLVVPFPTGDVLDNSARALAAGLTTALGQAVVVDNRAGASGSLAAEAVAKSEQDGYTLLYTTVAMLTITPQLRKTAYDPVNDFDPVARVSSTLLLVALNNGFPASDWRGFVAEVRRNPGKYSVASSGEGTLLHLSGEQIQEAAGIKLLHVPFKGMQPAQAELLAGRINVYIESSIIPFVQAGRAKAVLVFTPKRIPELPSVPTAAEVGFPVEPTPWFGIMVKKGTARDIVERLSKEIGQVTSSKEFASRLPAGAAPAYLPTAAFARQIATERAGYKAVIQRLNLKLE